MEKEKICVHCREIIDLEKDKYVLLGTYHGDNILEEGFYHFICFQKWYNSKVIEKTKNTIQDATKKVSGLLGGLRKMAVTQSASGDQGYIDFSAEVPNMEQEIPTVNLGIFKKKKKKDGKKRRKTN